MDNQTWRLKDGLCEWEFIIHQDQKPFADLIQSLILMLNEDLAEITSIEVSTCSEGEEAYVTHLRNTDDVNSLISYINKTNDIQDATFFLKLICFEGEKKNPKRIPLIGGGKVMIFVDEEEDYFYITLMLDIDVYAPFYWERNDQTKKIADLNAPRLKRLLLRMNHDLKGQLVEENVPDYLTEYLDQIEV